MGVDNTPAMFAHPPSGVELEYESKESAEAFCFFASTHREHVSIIFQGMH